MKHFVNNNHYVMAAVSSTLMLLSATSYADKIVKIGLATPLTGPDASWGKDNENAAKLAIEDLNKKGLKINNEKIVFQLQSEDDADDPKQGTVVAQRLVDSKVAAVVGHFSSGVTIPASRLYNEAGIPQLSVSVNAAYTNQGFDNAFRLSAVDTNVGPALAKFVKEGMKAKTVALIDDRTAYSQGLTDRFETAAKSIGLKVARREYTDQKAADLLPILSSIKLSKPDAIFMALSDAQAATFSRQYKQLGLTAKVIGGDMFQTDQFLKLAAGNGENFMSGVAGGMVSERAQGKLFLQKYKARYNTTPLAYGPQHYDGVMLVAEAIKQANSTDPKTIKAQLKKISYEGAIAKYSFDSKGDLNQAPITIYQVKNGAWVGNKVIN